MNLEIYRYEEYDKTLLFKGTQGETTDVFFT